MDGDGIQGHVGSAGGQADQTSLVALEVDHGENVGGAEEQSNETA